MRRKENDDSANQIHVSAIEHSKGALNSDKGWFSSQSDHGNNNRLLRELYDGSNLTRQKKKLTRVLGNDLITAKFLSWEYRSSREHH